MSRSGAPTIRRCALLLIVAGLLSLPALAAAAPARAARASSAASLRASPPRILQPPQGHAIVTGRSFRVVAALPRHAGKLGARIGEHGVAGRFHRRRDGRYAARIPTRLAGGPGFHFLLITYTDASGRHALGLELIVARRHQRPHKPPRGRLLSVHVAGHRVAGVARLHLNAPRADQWSVRVNGRDVSDRLADHAGFLRDGSLSASTGLHQGTNEVAVLAAREDGTRALRRFTVGVRPHTPIPDAGRPRRVAAGDRVRLGSPGGAAEPSRPRNRLEHAWTIVAAPKRSEARLHHPRAARPRFRPDVKGTYWIADRVTERTPAGELVGRSARDLVEVAATPTYVPPIGELIETLATGSEGQLGIKLGGSFFTLEGGQAAVQVLMIDPATLSTWTKTFEAPAEALGAIESEGTNPGTIVVVQGRQLPSEGSWREAISNQLGVPGSWANPAGGGSPSFSAIGAKGSAVGQGWGNTAGGGPGNGTTGALQGYLAPNYELTKNSEDTTYTFTPGTYSNYDTNITGAGAGATTVTAQVGPIRVSGSVPSGQAGFLVAELDAGDLALRSSQSFAVAAAGSGENYNQGEIEALAKWLGEHGGSADALILIQSIGSVPSAPQASSRPVNMSLIGAWAKVSGEIGLLGGHQNLFNTIGGGGYSFLGGLALREAGVEPAENGTTLVNYYKPPVVRQAGLLQLGHLGTLVPAANTPITTPNASAESNPAAVGNFELPVIAYHRPTPWPYEPGSEEPYGPDPTVVAAVHYISEKICNPDCDGEVRHIYAHRDFDLTDLLETGDEGKEFHCPAEGGSWEGTAFSGEDCETAKKELEREYTMISHLSTYFGTTSEGLLYPLNVVVGEKQSGLQAIGNHIEEALHPPKEARTKIGWQIFFQSFATALEAIDPEDIPFVTAVSTELDASLNLAQAWSVTPGGESIFQLETTVDKTVERVAQMVSAQEASIGNLRAVIVTDYGKLQEMYANTGGDDPQWELPADWTDVKEQLGYGMRSAFYRTFLPPLSETREEGGSFFDGYRDTVFPQNVCVNWGTEEEYPEESGPRPPEPPHCGTSSPLWRANWNLSGVVCWWRFSKWHQEAMGEDWAGAEYVVAGKNAISELAFNPNYTEGEGSGATLGYSPTWHVVIRPEKPFSSSEAPFPVALAEEIQGEPTSSNFDGGLPPWLFYEAFEPEDMRFEEEAREGREPGICAPEWEGA